MESRRHDRCRVGCVHGLGNQPIFIPCIDDDAILPALCESVVCDKEAIPTGSSEFNHGHILCQSLFNDFRL